MEHLLENRTRIFVLMIEVRLYYPLRDLVYYMCPF